MSLIKNKKAILGGFIATFLAIIFIVIILILFALFSTVIKTVEGVTGGEIVIKKMDLSDYMIEFGDLISLKKDFYGKTSFEIVKLIEGFKKK